MKQFFAGALLLSCLSLPASASSIEYIDEMVTGAKGSSSIITLGKPQPCTETACVDKSGGDANMNTASAAQQAALQLVPVKKINFDFARKYPDPAIPVATAAPEAETGGSSATEVPAAPADSGNVAAQPPAQSQPDPAAIGAPTPEALETSTRGSIDPNAPIMPTQSAEARESE